MKALGKRLEADGRADIERALRSYQRELRLAGLSDAEIERLVARRHADLDTALQVMLASARRRFHDSDARDH